MLCLYFAIALSMEMRENDVVTWMNSRCERPEFGVAGLYNYDTQSIFIYVENISVEESVHVCLHEIGHHFYRFKAPDINVEEMERLAEAFADNWVCEYIGLEEI